jgi:hypothetical protein
MLKESDLKLVGDSWLIVKELFSNGVEKRKCVVREVKTQKEWVNLEKKVYPEGKFGDYFNKRDVRVFVEVKDGN